jgi:hypothetical protein
MLQLTSVKPVWSGAKASLKPRTSAVATPSAAAKTWALNADEDDGELMDDEELLTEDDKRPIASETCCLHGVHRWLKGDSVLYRHRQCTC